jgi:hypothetical protein
MLAADEGHGFAKKANVELRLLGEPNVWQQTLLD